jgi:hypothetical protein
MAVQELEPALAGSPDPEKPRRWPGRALLTRLDHPIVPGLVAVLATLGFVLARWQRWSRGHIASWILIGQRFAGPGLPQGVPTRTGTGYDGQFYYRLALDPANLHQTAYGITLDAPYRLMRIGYPALTWLASFGHGSLVPVMLVAVNVAAMTAMGFFGGMFARQGQHHALWGLLLPLYFGLLTSIARDTAEPVACAFLLAGLLAIRGRRPVLAGLLLAFGALTRETVMVAVCAFALVRILKFARHPRQVRPGREDVAWLLPAIAFTGWEFVARAVIGSFPVLADGSRNAGEPFIAVFDAIRNNLQALSWTQFTEADDWLLELATLIVVAGIALLCLRRTRVPMHERVALIAYLIEICVVTPSTWNSLNADMRSFVEVYLLAVIVVLGVPRTRWPRSGTWLNPLVAAWALPTLYLVGMHRLVWS